MRFHGRWKLWRRHAAKRGALGVALAVAYAMILAIAVVSGRWGVMWIEHDWQTCAELDVGAVHVLWISKGASMAFAPSRLEIIEHEEGWGWSGWKPRVDFGSAGQTYVCLPLWMLGLPLLIPTFTLLARRDPLPQRPCAACGYELIGNESGVCSECGTKVLGN